jgi:hypothetical protein
MTHVAFLGRKGVRHPEGPARILLQVIDREPEAVKRALRRSVGNAWGLCLRCWLLWRGLE